MKFVWKFQKIITIFFNTVQFLQFSLVFWESQNHKTCNFSYSLKGRVTNSKAFFSRRFQGFKMLNPEIFYILDSKHFQIRLKFPENASKRIHFCTSIFIFCKFSTNNLFELKHCSEISVALSTLNKCEKKSSNILYRILSWIYD